MTKAALDRLQTSGKIDAIDRLLAERYGEIMRTITLADEKYGFVGTTIADYVHHIYKDEGKFRKLLATGAHQNPDWMFNINLPFAKQRRVRTIALAKEMGLDPIEDLAVITAFRYALSLKAQISVDFQREVADMYGRKALELSASEQRSVARQGYVEFYSDELEQLRVGDLNGILIPKDVADYMRSVLGESTIQAWLKRTMASETTMGELARTARSLIHAYDYLTRMFKGGAVRSLGFMTRNARTNTQNTYLTIGLAAVSPNAWGKTFDMMFHERPQGILELADRSQVPLVQVKAWANEQGVLRAGHLGLRDFFEDVRTPDSLRFELFPYVNKTQVKASTLRALERSDLNFARFFYDPDNYINRLSRWTNTQVESAFRLEHFVVELQRTADPVVAAERVNKFLFDYNNLSWVDREIMRRVAPFWTFTRKNLPLQLEFIAREPGRITAAPKLINSVAAAIQGNDPIGLIDPMGAFPIFVQNQFGAYMGLDEDGNPMMLTNVDLPVEEINRIWGGGAPETLNQLLQMVNPWVKNPIEYLTNRSTFTGGPIDDPEIQTYYERVATALAKFPVTRNWLEISEETYKDPRTGEEKTIYRMDALKGYLFLDVFGQLFGARRLETQMRQLEKLGDDKVRIPGIVNLILGASLTTLDLQSPKGVLTSKGVGVAYDTWEDRITKAAYAFGSPGNADHANVFTFQNRVEQAIEERSLNLAAAEARRVARLTGSEKTIEANRQFLAQLFRAPGVEGAIAAYKAVKPLDMDGSGVVDTPEEWQAFHLNRDRALWQQAVNQGGPEPEQVKRYWAYQEAITQAERDRIAEIQNPQARDLVMWRWETAQQMKEMDAIPRYVGLSVEEGQYVDDIRRQVNARVSVLPDYLQTMRRPLAIRQWAEQQAQKVGAPGTAAYNRAVAGFMNDAHRADIIFRFPNPMRQKYLDDHPDIWYWFFGKPVMSPQQYREWKDTMLTARHQESAAYRRAAA